jgi:hypothetical protein
MKDHPNCVRKTNGEPEAQQVKAFLEAHDIPCELRGESLRVTHALTLDGLGVVQVIVPEELVPKAKELLAEVDSGALEISELDGLQGDEEPGAGD